MLLKNGREVMRIREHHHFRYLEEVVFRLTDKLLCLVYLHFGEIINDRITASAHEATRDIGLSEGKLLA